MAAEVVCSINQPSYLPWLGFFDRIQRSDIHVILDHVQFEKGSYTNRVRIWENSPRGWQWLTVPVGAHGRRFGTIKGTMVTGGAWPKKHARTLKEVYGLTGIPWLHPLKSYVHYDTLGPLLQRSTDWLLDLLKIDTPLLYSSKMKPTKHKSELVLELCQKVGATKYLSGPGGRDYLDIRAFEHAGIQVVYHDFPRKTIVLSALDALFNPRSAKEWPQPVLTSDHS